MILLSLLTFALPLVFADVEFTTPIGGANVPVGKIHVAWKDSGLAPPITDLTLYTLNLMVGGNDAGNMLSLLTFKAGGDFTDGNTGQATIPAGLSAPVPNGFFFRIISTSSTGGTVVNYSDRFTITGLNGHLASTYQNAAAALNGNTSGPPRSGNAITSPSSGSAVPTNSGSSTRSGPTVTVTKDRPVDATPTVPFKHSDNSSNDSGLIGGVVVACIVFLGAVIGFGLWACTRRKRRRNGVEDLDDKDAFGKQPSVTTLSELSSDGRVVHVELGDGKPPPEMDSNSIRAELEGDYMHEPSEVVGTPVGTFTPLTPIAPSISEETLASPTTLKSMV